jgi:hypothetical protein
MMMITTSIRGLEEDDPIFKPYGAFGASKASDGWVFSTTFLYGTSRASSENGFYSWAF